MPVLMELECGVFINLKSITAIFKRKSGQAVAYAGGDCFELTDDEYIRLVEVK